MTRLPIVRRSFSMVVLTAGATAALVACSSSDRPAIVDTPDAGDPPSLPDASNVADASIDDDGAVQKPPFDGADEAVDCGSSPASACAVEIVAGENHFCARMNDGHVRCWGDDTKGSLGAGSDSSTTDGGTTAHVVGTVVDLADVKQLSAGGTATCAVDAEGDVRCWGGNERGQLGLQATTASSDADPHPTPDRVALTSPASRVSLGTNSACAVLASGSVFCWGDNTRRQLARSTTEAIGAPAEASLGSEPLVRTAAGTYSAFGISTAGDVRVWGAVAGNDGCTSARTASIDRDPNPTSIGLGPVTSLSVSSTTVVQAVSYAHACAVVAGDVLCWGQSAWGALGTGLPGGVVTPTRALVRSKTAWAQRVAAGGETTCVRLTDGKVECTGKNVHGALGRDTKDTFSMFFEPADAFTGYAVSVAVSQSAVCALQKEGRVACWGSNEHGELGQGTTDLDSHSTPLSVEF